MRGKQLDKNAAGKRQRLILYMAAAFMLICAVSVALLR
jgi:hypothetical protein